MLADDVAVAGGGRDGQLLRQQISEARRIEVGAGAEHAVPRQPAQPPRHPRQDVHWVARYYKHRIRAVLHQLQIVTYLTIITYFYEYCIVPTVIVLFINNQKASQIRH